jgi:prepilin-type N-terminal cleavage/methylation domain-containing protein
MECKDRRYRDHYGFTLIEMLVAIVILGGGLLALATGLTQGMMIVTTSHYHQIAKEKAAEAMESIFTARDARKIKEWSALRNAADGGIFLNGPLYLRDPGPDGLVNTADDGEPEVHVHPGPDGIAGTDDDVVTSLTNFTRELVIIDIGSNSRQIQVIVRYNIGHLSREYRIVSCITPFS